MGYLRKYINKYGFLFTVAILFLIVEAICDLLLPTILASIIDKGIANKDMQYVFEKGGLMLLVTGIGAVAAIVRNILSSNISQKFGAELRFDLYKKIQSFTLNQMNRFEAATLVTRLTNDVTQVQVFVNGLMRIMVKAPILCIGSIIMAVRLNPALSWILLIVIPVVGIIIAMNLKLSFPFFIKVQKATDKVNAVMREYLSGIRVIKAFNRSRFEKQRFGERNAQLTDTSIKAMRVMSVFNPGISLSVNFGIVAVLLVGGWNINEGHMQVGQVVAYVNYMTQILFSLMMISMIFNVFVRARVSAGRIGEVFSTEDEIPHTATKRNEEESKGISFEHVSFSYYESQEYVLKDITFTVKEGETIGIIGSTGAGKSSLVNLLPRLYEPTKGSICINGDNIQTMDLKKLRDAIAYVPQKSVLFTGTIKDNILWGKEEASMEEVIKAAKIAHAHDFIENFPDGYNTWLGQGGVNLSGGQKQRISIARALIKQPDILILDDSTSAIDVMTEQQIKQSLTTHKQEMTIFLIAQRITSIMDTDKIIVLENGEIAGIGIHDELAQHNQVYQEILASQLGEEVARLGE